MAFFFAGGQLIIRSISYLEHPATSLAYQIVVGLGLMTLVLPFVWVTPATVFDLGIFVLSGVLGAGGHYCMILAFQRTAARVVVRRRRTLYQRTYPSPEVTDPEISASSAPGAYLHARMRGPNLI